MHGGGEERKQRTGGRCKILGGNHSKLLELDRGERASRRVELRGQGEL